MALNYPQMGEGYVSAYQVSATPYVTSSTISSGQIKEVNFDQVSRFIFVKNTGASRSEIKVAFTENGFKPSNSNFFSLGGGESFQAELRTDRLFISGSTSASGFSVIAGLTAIPSKMLVPITGSSGYGGVG